MLRSLSLAALLAFSVPALACPMTDAAAYKTAVEKVDAATGTKVSIAVTGLKDGDCSSKVAALLKQVDGVVEAAVDYQSGTTRVAYDASKTSTDKLVTAIAAAGYTAKVDKAS